MGEGDDWPWIREEIVNSGVLIMASPTWVGTSDDGAHHVISEINGALGDIGFTIPDQAWSKTSTRWPPPFASGRSPPKPTAATTEPPKIVVPPG